MRTHGLDRLSITAVALCCALVSGIICSSCAPSQKDPNTQLGADQILRSQLQITEDYRESFVHGDKGPEFQKYIVLHDTEGDGDGLETVEFWDRNENGVAAHFVLNTDGTVVQCVPLDKIAHHAGYAESGKNALYGTEDESRDDKEGTVSIGEDMADYGMNSYSVGIEMVHVGDGDEYPEAQLQALDTLIAYINAYFGSDSTIINHRDWRDGNTDTSEEFESYLANYKDHGTHLPA